MSANTYPFARNYDMQVPGQVMYGITLQKKAED